MNGSVKTVTLPHAEVSASVLRDWPAVSRRAATLIVKRYGLPNEVFRDRLVWYYNSPWKRTVVWKDGKNHDQPYMHKDIVEQTVEYRFPPQHMSEISAFSSGITMDPEHDELTAHCDSEHANKILLNLAHEILIGTKSVLEARKILHTLSGALRVQWPDQYTEDLHFDWNDVVSDSPRRYHKKFLQQS